MLPWQMGKYWCVMCILIGSCFDDYPMLNYTLNLEI